MIEHSRKDFISFHFISVLAKMCSGTEKSVEVADGIVIDNNDAENHDPYMATILICLLNNLLMV